MYFSGLIASDYTESSSDSDIPFTYDSHHTFTRRVRRLTKTRSTPKADTSKFQLPSVAYAREEAIPLEETVSAHFRYPNTEKARCAECVTEEELPMEVDSEDFPQVFQGPPPTPEYEIDPELRSMFSPEYKCVTVYHNYLVEPTYTTEELHNRCKTRRLCRAHVYKRNIVRDVARLVTHEKRKFSKLLRRFPDLLVYQNRKKYYSDIKSVSPNIRNDSCTSETEEPMEIEESKLEEVAASDVCGFHPMELTNALNQLSVSSSSDSENACYLRIPLSSDSDPPTFCWDSVNEIQMVKGIQEMIQTPLKVNSLLDSFKNCSESVNSLSNHDLPTLANSLKEACDSVTRNADNVASTFVNSANSIASDTKTLSTTVSGPLSVIDFVTQKFKELFSYIKDLASKCGPIITLVVTFVLLYTCRKFILSITKGIFNLLVDLLIDIILVVCVIKAGTWLYNLISWVIKIFKSECEGNSSEIFSEPNEENREFRRFVDETFFDAEEAQPQNSVFFTTGLTAILTLVFAWSTQCIPDTRSINLIIKRCFEIPRAISGLESMYQKISWLMDRVRVILSRWFNWKVEQDPQVLVMQKIDDIYLRTTNLLNKEDLDKIQCDSAVAEEVQQLFRDVHALHRSLNVRDLDRAVASKMNACMNVVRTLNEAATRSSAYGAGSKVEPYTIYLDGETGIGKTSLIYMLTGSIRTSEMTQEEAENYDFSKDVYNRLTDHEYWDGFTPDKMVCVVDDFGQVRDSTTAPSLDYMELIHASSSFPYELHMADLKDKGTTPYRCKLAVFTSNTPVHDLQIESLTCPNALKRRFKMCVHVKIKPQFMRNAALPNNTPVWTLDLAKVKEYQRANDLDDIYVTDVYNFVRYDPITGVVLGEYQWEQFLDVCITEYKRNLKQCVAVDSFIKRSILKQFLRTNMTKYANTIEVPDEQVSELTVSNLPYDCTPTTSTSRMNGACINMKLQTNHFEQLLDVDENLADLDLGGDEFMDASDLPMMSGDQFYAFSRSLQNPQILAEVKRRFGLKLVYLFTKDFENTELFNKIKDNNNMYYTFDRGSHNIATYRLMTETKYPCNSVTISEGWSQWNKDITQQYNFICENWPRIVSLYSNFYKLKTEHVSTCKSIYLRARSKLKEIFDKVKEWIDGKEIVLVAVSSISMVCVLIYGFRDFIRNFFDPKDYYDGSLGRVRPIRAVIKEGRISEDPYLEEDGPVNFFQMLRKHKYDAHKWESLESFYAVDDDVSTSFEINPSDIFRASTLVHAVDSTLACSEGIAQKIVEVYGKAKSTDKVTEHIYCRQHHAHDQSTRIIDLVVKDKPGSHRDSGYAMQWVSRVEELFSYCQTKHIREIWMPFMGTGCDSLPFSLVLEALATFAREYGVMTHVFVPPEQRDRFEKTFLSVKECINSSQFVIKGQVYRPTLDRGSYTLQPLGRPYQSVSDVRRNMAASGWLDDIRSVVYDTTTVFGKDNPDDDNIVRKALNPEVVSLRPERVNKTTQVTQGNNNSKLQSGEESANPVKAKNRTVRAVHFGDSSADPVKARNKSRRAVQTQFQDIRSKQQQEEVYTETFPNEKNSPLCIEAKNFSEGKVCYICGLEPHRYSIKSEDGTVYTASNLYKCLIDSCFYVDSMEETFWTNDEGDWDLTDIVVKISQTNEDVKKFIEEDIKRAIKVCASGQVVEKDRVVQLNAKGKLQLEEKLTQALFDINAHQVSLKLVKNIYRLEFKRKNTEDDWMMMGHILFVAGNYFIMNSHFVEYFVNRGYGPQDVLLRYKNVFHPEGVPMDSREFFSSIRVSDHAITGKNPNFVKGTEGDIRMGVCKKAVTHSDIRNSIATRDDHQKASVAPGMLMSLSRGDKVIVPMAFVLNNITPHDKLCYYYDKINEETCNEFVLRKSYHYRGFVMPGDCGSPLIMSNPSLAGKIIGMHAFGIQSNNTGGSVPLTRETIILAMTKLSGVVNVEGFGKKYALQEDQISNTIPNVYPVGKIEKIPYVSTKSKIYPTPLNNTYKENLSMPAKLKMFVHNGELVNPFEKGISKMSHPFVSVDQDLVDTAVNHYTNKLLDMDDDFTVTNYKRVMSNVEALYGNPDIPFITSVNMTTSAGFPYVLEEPCKYAWIQGDPEKQERFAEVLEECESQLKKGRRIEAFYVATLKDERRPISKVLEGKTRLFTAGPAHLTVLIRKYFLGFAAFLQRNRIKCEAAVGINAISREWSDLVEHLHEAGTSVFAGDFSNFDGSLNREILWGILDVINNWYDDGEEKANIRRILFLEIIQSTQIIGHDVVRLSKSQPSGNPLTVIVNCVYSSIFCRYVWLQVAPKEFKSLSNFDKHSRHVFYGDDDLHSLSDFARSFYNQESYAKIASACGMTYTDESKKQDFVQWRTIEEVSFLKRKFLYNKLMGLWMAPLELDSVLETPQWTRKSRMAECDRIVENCENTFLELYFHGREIYEKWTSDIMKVLREKRKKGDIVKLPHCPSFVECGFEVEALYGLDIQLPHVMCGVTYGMD